MYFKKLEGDRIYLSPPNVEDAGQYAQWMADFSVSEGLGNAANVLTEAGEKKWAENAGEYQFAIIRKKDHKLLGNCGIEEPNFIRRTANVGLFIGEEENRGKGYGTEVLGLLLDYGFDYLNLHNIELAVFSFNERAIACYSKVGFHEIGRRREAYYIRGSYYDDVYMDILQREWKEKRGKK